MHYRKWFYMAYPEPIKPLGQKESEIFFEQLSAFKLSQAKRDHFRRLRNEAEESRRDG